VRPLSLATGAGMFVGRHVIEAGALPMIKTSGPAHPIKHRLDIMKLSVGGEHRSCALTRDIRHQRSLGNFTTFNKISLGIEHHIALDTVHRKWSLAVT
jgi:hypothetical protein